MLILLLLLGKLRQRGSVTYPRPQRESLSEPGLELRSFWLPVPKLRPLDHGLRIFPADLQSKKK